MTYADWEWRPLGELFEIGAGKTMSSLAREGAEKVPFLRTSNVLWDRMDLSSVDAMAIPPHELPDKLLRPGDLLVCEGGEIGRAAVWNGQIEVCSFQNHLHRLRPRGSDVDPRFYVYFLQSAFTQLGIFEGAGNKTTIPNLSRSSLAALTVLHPPLPEQRLIVEALSAVRCSIEVHERSAVLAAELKQATLRHLFARGLHSEAVKDSEIGTVPASWAVVDFGSVRESLQYGTSIRCSYESTPFPVLRIPNIEPSKVNVRDLKFGNMTSEEAERYQLHHGDVLIIRTNALIERLGTCAVYEGQPQGALFASYLIRARLKRDLLDPYFAAYYFASDRGTSVVGGRATPSADGKYNLNTGTIDRLPVPLPTLSEQRSIVEVLQAVDRKIDLHQQKRARLHELFTILLYKVMTGAVHLNELDTSVLVEVRAPGEPAA